MRLRLLGVVLAIWCLLIGPAAAIDSKPAPAIQVQSLIGNYYLDRDAQGVSTLVAEEAISIQFPVAGASFSQFNRVLPTEYLKKNNALKITGVSQASGQPVPYSTTYDQGSNLVINIGDPSITLFGSQSFIIKYQSKGVINFLGDKQQFYPNFNGRGWTSTFPNLSGIVHLSNSLATQLAGKPRCLIDSGKCQVDVKQQGNQKIYTFSSLTVLPAHQSLTAQVDFKPGTFKPYKAPSGLDKLPKIVGISLSVLIASAVIRSLIERRRQQINNNKLF